MFQYVHFYKKEYFDPGFRFENIPGIEYDRIVASDWQEHCLECAAPLCFGNCINYSKRFDNSCRNLEYGIFPKRYNKETWRILKFRPWGKIETVIFPYVCSKKAERRIDGLNRFLSSPVRFLMRILSFIPKAYKIGEWYCAVYKKIFERKHSGTICDTFIFEALSDSGCKLFIDIISGNKELLFRESFDVKQGYNSVKIKVAPSALQNGKYARVYPEGNAVPSLAIRNSAFVKLKDSDVPAKKVKCVVWDLDNTMWSGILSENGSGEMKLRDGVGALLKAIDERGILNSIASKNDYEPAMECLKKLGIADYFLCPQINWGPKSDSIEKIAGILNLGIDSFAFVDDSAFEREEVKNRFPCMRIYDEKIISGMLVLPEFDVTVTADSVLRRSMYITEIQRKKDFEGTRSDIKSFIRNCEVKIDLKCPDKEEDLERCFELANRTNQLNLSGKKYTAEEFKALISEDGTQTLYGTCADKYGSYGGVLFMKYRMEEAGIIRVYEFAMSCRIAAKYAENAVIAFLLEKADTVIFEGNRTAKNKVLTDSLLNAGMENISAEDEKILLRISGKDRVNDPDIVSVHLL
ncbi:MAG: HAD-IIIC family phosphatase [Clostridia bacterium]|nr:HAD-IIIC family phosphatase [Clostridia bacterium]